MVTFPAAKFSSADGLISALDWWRDAGVDQDFSDEAQCWLKEARPDVASAPDHPPEPSPLAVQFKAPPPPPRARIGGDPADWPQDLAAFQAWWLTEPSLDAAEPASRVPPRGVIGAALMVIVDYPEAQDSDQLLSGPRGRLLRAVLAALGLDSETVYFASVLPRHMPMPDWAGLEAAGLGEIARHHVALVAPQRVLAFGGNVSSLLGHDPAKSVQPLPQIWGLGAGLPALAAPELESLMARPMGKARLWQALLDWLPG